MTEIAAFDYSSSTRMVVGSGTIARLGTLAADLGGRRALVVSDPGVVRAGHTSLGVASLEQAGLVVECFTGLAENPTTEHVDSGTACARAFRPDIIVGIGGGSSMDCAKGINFLLCCGGRMADYWGRGKATASMLPSIAVPTTAGTGSEMQSFALITDAQTHVKMACGDPRAAFRVAILDVLLTLTQPARVTALAGIDALAHAVESHVSLAATPASRLFSREAFRLLANHLPQVFVSPADVPARQAVQLGAAWAGVAIENAMLGAAHALANPLTATHSIVHGQAVGMMLPHVVRLNAAACDDRYAELLAELEPALPAGPKGPAGLAGPAGEPAGERLARWLEEVVAAGGLVATLSGLRLPEIDIKTLAAAAATQWTGSFNPVPVGVDQLARLYEAAR